MHSKDFLAQELRKAGLEEMAVKAEAGYYHDFLSELAFPEMQLDADLVHAMQSGNVAAHALRKRHHNGEFDATTEESDEWAASPDGIAAFGLLVDESLKGKK
jgi:hypothetical protein